MFQQNFQFGFVSHTAVPLLTSGHMNSVAETKRMEKKTENGRYPLTYSTGIWDRVRVSVFSRKMQMEYSI